MSSGFHLLGLQRRRTGSNILFVARVAPECRNPRSLPAATPSTWPLTLGQNMDSPVPTKKSNSVTIVDITIPVIEHEGERVITLLMMDQLHHKPEGSAKKRFHDHREKFVEGKHFYVIDYAQRSVFRTFGIEIPPRGITVLTERGYSMLVKSFTDDFAWEVQDQLVDGYFDAKQQLTTAEFLLHQAQMMVDQERRINAVEIRQDRTEQHVVKTNIRVGKVEKIADDAFEAAQAALQHKFGDSNYLTIIAYCGKHGIKVSGAEAKAYGMRAGKLSRGRDKNIIKVPDERWGNVNSYHVDILSEVFADLLSKKT